MGTSRAQVSRKCGATRSIKDREPLSIRRTPVNGAARRLRKYRTQNRISTSALLGLADKDGFDLAVFAHHISGADHDTLTFFQAAQNFQLVAIVPAHIDLPEVNHVAVVHHSDKRSRPPAPPAHQRG